MTQHSPILRRRSLAAIAILFALTGCEMLELVGQAPSLDAAMPDCVSLSSCAD